MTSRLALLFLCVLTLASDIGRARQASGRKTAGGTAGAFVPYGCGVNPVDSLVALAGSPAIGQAVVLGVDNPVGTQVSGLAFLLISSAPDSAFPCGTLVPNVGMSGAGAAGELLITAPAQFVFGGEVWSFFSGPTAFGVQIPDQPSLVGSSFFAQGFVLDLTGAAVTVGLTGGLELRVGGGDNSPPSADAGADQTVGAGGRAFLDGSGSTDPDGDDLNYAWAFTSRPAGSSAVLSDPSGIAPSFVADQAGEYVIELVVDDGLLPSTPDQVVVSALPLGMDTDGDGAPDYLEILAGYDPLDPKTPSPAGAADTNDDGVPQSLEIVLADLGSAAPVTARNDTDADGVPDVFEVLFSSHPFDGDSPVVGGGADTNDATGPGGDTLSDALEHVLITLGARAPVGHGNDSDDDGAPDHLEVISNTDAFDGDDPVTKGALDPDRDRMSAALEFVLERLGAQSPVSVGSDTDEDGAPDFFEVIARAHPVDADDPVSFGATTGFDSNPATGPDGDGISDALELLLIRRGASAPVSTFTDSDSDGLPDYVEVRIATNPFNANEPVPGGGSDSDGDGISNALELLLIVLGSPGPITVDTDTDEDGAPDYIEIFQGTDPFDSTSTPQPGTPPVAMDVQIVGVADVGQNLSGAYSYFDADGEPEGASSYRWLRDGTPLPGQTGLTYEVVAEDFGRTLTFEVTPVSDYSFPPATSVGEPAAASLTLPVLVHSTQYAAAATAPLLVSGPWLVYFASESMSNPAGTDLNGDGDSSDQVLVSVDLVSGIELQLGVATLDAAILDDEIYLVVDEGQDGVDWNGNATQFDRVLLHWSQSTQAVEFVDVLRPSTLAEPLLHAGTSLYYATAAPRTRADETSIRRLTTSAPTSPQTLMNQLGEGQLDAELVAEDEGLLFLSLNETAIGQDLNGDGDSVDLHVLGLVDGTDPLARVKNVGLALADGQSPVASRSTGSNDWLVAFLVDESSQGAVNLNDPSLFGVPLVPPACMGMPDSDATDQILHFLDFAAFLAGSAQPVNTGIPGHARVLVLPGFVATIGPEFDTNCDLNADGDLTDEVARWVATSTPVAPNVQASEMHALATTIPGGAQGLAWIGGRLVAVVSEAGDSQDLDGKPPEHDLVAWLDPALPTWNFQHQHPTVSSIGTGVFDSMGNSEPYAGASWMAAEPVGGRLGMTFLEEVPGTNPNVGSLNTNVDCMLVLKDADKIDALPVWADFESGPTLDFDGLGYAVDSANAGLVITATQAFFRVSEADDNRDYNGDGDLSDDILLRNPLSSCAPAVLGTSSGVFGDVVATDGLVGAGFLSSESQAGIDFNGDGDAIDFVVRYYRF